MTHFLHLSGFDNGIFDGFSEDVFIEQDDRSVPSRARTVIILSLLSKVTLFL